MHLLHAACPTLAVIILLSFAVPFASADTAADDIKDKIQKATINPWVKGSITLMEWQERKHGLVLHHRRYSTVGADGIQRSLLQVLFVHPKGLDWEATWEFGDVMNLLQIGQDRYRVFPHSKVLVKHFPIEVPENLAAMARAPQQAFNRDVMDRLRRFAPVFVAEAVGSDTDRLLKITMTIPKGNIDATVEMAAEIAKSRLAGQEPSNWIARMAWKRQLTPKAIRARTNAKLEYWIDEDRNFIRRKVAYNEAGEILEQEELTNVVHDYRGHEDLFALPQDYQLVLEKFRGDWRMIAKLSKEDRRLHNALRLSKAAPRSQTGQP